MPAGNIAKACALAIISCTTILAHMISARKKFFLWFLACLFVASVLIAGFLMYRSIVAAGYPSCVLSAEDALSSALSYGEMKRTIPIGVEWRTLSSEEAELLFASVKERRIFDCKNFPRMQQGQDSYGERLLVLVRKGNERVEVQIQDDSP